MHVNTIKLAYEHIVKVRDEGGGTDTYVVIEEGHDFDGSHVEDEDGADEVDEGGVVVKEGVVSLSLLTAQLDEAVTGQALLPYLLSLIQPVCRVTAHSIVTVCLRTSTSHATQQGVCGVIII